MDRLTISDISKDYKRCIRKEIAWSDFIKAFQVPVRGEETLEEYKKLPKEIQDKLKNVGGYVGGVFKDDIRKKENLLFRSLITLDLDNIEANTLDNVLYKINTVIGHCNYLVHSSRKHSIISPRLRIIIPLDRYVSYEEYEAISRKIGELIGFSMCDRTTFESSRLMYYPSCCKDADYVFRVNQGQLLNADTVLNMYTDWKDKSNWVGLDSSDIYKTQRAKQEDPLTKEGYVGEFCRAYYPINEAIEEFLNDVYTPCDNGRYTYIKGSTVGGVIIYDDKFTFSHHNTDPVGGKLCNAFDLVRYHKFKDLDINTPTNTNIKELPSYKAMVELSNSLDRVKKQREKDSYLKAVNGFSTVTDNVNNSTPFLTNINKVRYSAREGFDVYIVQGDREASKLNELGYTSTYISSNDDNKVWEYSYSEFFKGANVVIVQNNNDNSKSFVDDTKKKLKYYAHSIKTIVLDSDLLDYFSDHSKGDFKDLVTEAKKDYAPWVCVNDKGKVSINEGQLAAAISKSLAFINKPMGNKSLNYLYKNGVYIEISKNELKKEISKYMPNYIMKNSLVSNITELVMLSNSNSNISFEGRENIINFKNGLYDVKTKKLKPHTKNYTNLIQINANYKDNPINKGYWDKFIDDLTLGQEELKLIIQEWFGLVISNYNGALVKRIFILYGKGDTGKSKVINVLTSLLNEKNTKSIAIQNFEDRFSLSSLNYTRLVFNADLPTNTIKDKSLALLKQLTGGDTINIEKKNIDCIDVIFKGLLMYGSNKLPSLSGDLGNWVYNRFLIFPCDNPIPEEKQDPKILDKLLKDKEYIINWSLKGLERLMNNDFKFSYGKIIKDVKEAYKIDTDSLRAFIKDRYIITGDKKDRIPAKLLKDDYSIYWCPDNDIMPVTKNFKNRLLNVSDDIEYKNQCKYKGKNTSCYLGIKRIEDLYLNDL